MKRFTNRQKLFIDNYVISFNATGSAVKAGYSPKTARVIGPRLLLNGAVKEEVERRIDGIREGMKVTEESIVRNLLDLAKTAKRESDRIRAWELLGKYRGLFKDSTTVVAGVFSQLNKTQPVTQETRS